MERWVVIKFYKDNTYSTFTYDSVEEALALYDLEVKLQNEGKIEKSKIALVLEGSELPIDGYVPNDMAIRKEIKK